MANIKLPYSGEMVRTKRQSREFFRNVLMPVADKIAGCSFQTSGLYQVERSQNISESDGSADWAEIGFKAVRLDPRVRPSIIQFNIWAHNATDTSVIPFPERAQKALAAAPEDSPFGGSPLMLEFAIKPDNEDDDELADSGFEDVAVEELDFYLDNINFRPIRDLDYTFARDGELVWQESHSNPDPSFWVGDTVPDQVAMMRTEHQLRDEFDAIDLEIIAGILGRLGLA